MFSAVFSPENLDDTRISLKRTLIPETQILCAYTRVIYIFRQHTHTLLSPGIREDYALPAGFSNLLCRLRLCGYTCSCTVFLFTSGKS